MPEKLERCVDDVKGKKGVDSAYAICTAATQESILKEIIDKKCTSKCGCNMKK